MLGDLSELSQFWGTAKDSSIISLGVNVLSQSLCHRTNTPVLIPKRSLHCCQFTIPIFQMEKTRHQRISVLCLRTPGHSQENNPDCELRMLCWIGETTSYDLTTLLLLRDQFCNNDSVFLARPVGVLYFKSLPAYNYSNSTP